MVVRFKVEYYIVKTKSQNIIEKLRVSWVKFIISDFDDAVQILASAINDINSMVDYAVQNKIEMNFNSDNNSKYLQKINKYLENHQYVEAADVVEYKLIKAIKNI